MAETASRNRGPETSPAPAEPGSTGGGNREHLKQKIKAQHQYNHTLTCPFRATGSSRPPGRGDRGRCQAPQESHSPNDRRSLGALVIHAEQEQGFGGGRIQAPRWSSGPGSRSHSPLTGGKSTVSASSGISGPSLSASRTRPPWDRGRHPGLVSQTWGLCRGHRSRWKGPHLWRRPGFLFP